MSKYKVMAKGNQVTVQRNLARGEQVNNQELSTFERKLITGCIPPRMMGNKTIMYVAQGAIPLKMFIRNTLSDVDFFIIVAQSIEMVKRVELEGLNPSNLVFDLDCVFIRERSKELLYLYQPIMTKNMPGNLAVFLKDVIKLVSKTYVTPPFLKEFQMFISVPANLNLANLENYVRRVCPQAYQRTVAASAGNSGFITSDRAEHQNHYQNNPQNNSQMYGGGMQNNPQMYGGGMQNNPQMYGGGMQNNPQMYGGGMQNNPQMYGGGMQNNLQNNYDESGTTLLYEPDEGTTILEDEGDTTLLTQEMERYPILMRRKTGERMEVRQSGFVIGKDNSCNFRISDNKTVSRKHATIENRGGRYFIIDNNSTNHSYVNHQMLPAGQPFELFDGVKIRLSDEEFDFMW